MARADCARADAERAERQGWSEKRRRQEARGALSRLALEAESGAARTKLPVAVPRDA